MRRLDAHTREWDHSARTQHIQPMSWPTTFGIVMAAQHRLRRREEWPSECARFSQCQLAALGGLTHVNRNPSRTGTWLGAYSPRRWAASRAFATRAGS